MKSFYHNGLHTAPYPTHNQGNPLSEHIIGRVSLAKLEKCIISVLFLICSFTGCLTHAQAKEINLVFASDMPIIDDEQHGDYAELANFLAQKRADSRSTFFLFGGGSIGPSPMSTFDRGSHIIDVLNSLEPDAMGVTKREFSYFEDELSQRSYEAAFPIVASNLFDPITGGNLDGLTDSIIVSKGGIKLGIISIINQEVVSEYLLERLMVLAPRQALIDSANAVREQGADLVVLLYSDPFDFIQNALDSAVIDLAIFFDPHFNLTHFTDLPQHPNSIASIKLGDVLDITVSINKGASNQVNASWREISLSNFKPFPTVEAQISEYTARLDRLLNQRIGTFNTRLDTTRPSVRSRESAFGNMLTDAIKKYAAADIAIINGGVIRGEKRYSKGDEITRRDIALELPFRSHINVIEVSGAQILAALENGFSEIEELRGRFPQVSGLQIEYDSSAPAGNRVLSVTFDGEPLSASQTFRLATSDYIASGGDGYDMLKDTKKINMNTRATPLISDILVNEILSEGVLSPRIEGRLVNKAND